ncbi:MAG: SpoIVB peptidase S55 domain-containing protein [Acidobacteriota bacterium]
MAIQRTSGPGETMGVDELRAGMRGVGYTVIRGTEPEEFGVEILGVLKDTMPKQDIVVARLSGLGLEESGVAAGMSGSPVFIDGKLIGAVSYRLGAFQKEPIAGITPIENMLRIADTEAQRNATAAAIVSGDDLLAATANLLAGRAADQGLLRPAMGAGGIVPIATPVTIGGVPAGLVTRLGPLFEALGWHAALGGTSSSPQANAPLRSGSTVAAQLMRGDITFAASGTVTYVDGDQLLAFGHPFLQGGKVDFPMVGGEVLLVLDSLSASEKLTAAGGEVIGAIRQDLQPGILGIVGAQPQTIPVKIGVEDGGGGESEQFNFEMITDKTLSPTFLFIGLASGLQSIGKMFGDSTFEVEGEFFLDQDLGSIKIRNLFSSPSQAYVPLSQMITSIYAFLYDNAFRSVGVDEIDLRIRVREDRKVAQISRVWSDRLEVRAGEKVDLAVWLKPYRAKEVVQHFTVEIPSDTPPGPLTLLIGDAAAVSREEQGFIQGEFAPQSLAHLVRLLNNIRANDSIYVQMSRPAEGAFFGGEPMPSLPISMLKVLSAQQTSGEIVRLEKTVMLEENYPVEYVVSGEHRLQLTVRRP